MSGVAFIDGASGYGCELVVPADGRVYPNDGEAKIGVLHPLCDAVADLAIELDAFYCPNCGWNGRISGEWAIETIERVVRAGESLADE